MNDHTQRINEIMQHKRMSATQFSEAIGIQRAAMSHITLGRNNPSADVLTKILEHFTDINPGWLMTGKGAMKISTDIQSEGLFDESHFKTKQSVKEKSGQTSNIQADSPHDSNKNEAFPSLHKSMDVQNQLENSKKNVEKEKIIVKEKSSKTIDKLMILYSDRTYDTFLPEKTDY